MPVFSFDLFQSFLSQTDTDRMYINITGAITIANLHTYAAGDVCVGAILLSPSSAILFILTWTDMYMHLNMSMSV